MISFEDCVHVSGQCYATWEW